MTIKVVGAGLGRTATASLKQALEELLGGTCHHMFEVGKDQERQLSVWTAAARGEMPNWHEFLKDYSAIVDWPGCSFWPELSEAFPDALVLLSTRDLEKWYESASATIFTPPDNPESDFSVMWQEVTRNRFCPEFENREKMIGADKAHQDAVIETIPADRLLIWTASDGWGPICDRLGLPVPDRPFPRTNSRKEFWEKYSDE